LNDYLITHTHPATAQKFFSSIEVVGGDENLITWLAKNLNKKEYGISETLKSALVSRYVWSNSFRWFGLNYLYVDANNLPDFLAQLCTKAPHEAFSPG
jgi:hypothetical protein